MSFSETYFMIVRLSTGYVENICLNYCLQNKKKSSILNVEFSKKTIKFITFIIKSVKYSLQIKNFT